MDLNVHLSHLIYELQDLQRGLDVIDASKPRGHQAFKLCVILTWTIQDLGQKGKTWPQCSDGGDQPIVYP